MEERKPISGVAVELIMNYRLMYLTDKMNGDTIEKEYEYHQRRMKENPPQSQDQIEAYEALFKEIEEESVN